MSAGTVPLSDKQRDEFMYKTSVRFEGRELVLIAKEHSLYESRWYRIDMRVFQDKDTGEYFGLQHEVSDSEMFEYWEEFDAELVPCKAVVTHRYEPL